MTASARNGFEMRESFLKQGLGRMTDEYLEITGGA